MGASPITFSEIAAWQELNGVKLTPWELSCIAALDSLLLTSQQKKQVKQT